MDDMMWYLLGLANGKGGKVNKLDMCDLFEQQTPLWSGNLFGDYSAKLVQLPEDTYYNRYRNYNYYVYADTPTGDITGSYCSNDQHNIVCVIGIYRGDVLLTLEWTTSTADQRYQYSTETIYDDEGTITGVKVYRSQSMISTFDFANMTSSEYFGATNYAKYFQVPETGVATYYASDGTVTQENTYTST